MALFPIDNLEPGMILKSAVCDRSGRMLLPAGIELEAKHLKIFRTWGVSGADIVGDEVDDDSQGDLGDVTGDPSALAAAQQEVELLFIHNDHHHQMIRELMRICISRRVSNAC
ncbi:MAG: hypothetical protein WCI45_06510 [Desulfuromonadales bacterium]